jgi:hypothetical protein
MKKQEGIDFLQECISACGSQKKAEDIFEYRIGNKTNLENYQSDVVKVDLKRPLPPGVKYVVKCLIHQNMFVAWRADDISWNWKFFIYKNQLIDAQNKPHEICITQVENKEVIIFHREKDLGIEFIKKFVIEAE